MEQLFPNIIKHWPQFIQSIIDTLYLMFWAGLYSFIFGIIFGVILVVTKKDGILPNAFIYKTLSFIVNIFRSIPFIILVVMLFDVTDLLMGTISGTKGALFPLIVGCTPFFARQIESSLSEVNPGLVEAAESMGISPLGIIFRVYLKESIPSIALGVSITLISLLGLTAMGGIVGGGGVGAFVKNYGFQRNRQDIVWVSVIFILILVSIIQIVCNFVAKKTKK